jgi:xanthine dehydrogenase YagT iron-sulfur-binding subunit
VNPNLSPVNAGSRPDFTFRTSSHEPTEHAGPKSLRVRAIPFDHNIDRNICMSHAISLTVNGERRIVELGDPRVTLLDLLRERLHLTGTKKGCDRGQCGACTVLVDGRRINACLALAVSCDGADVLTIEGVARGDELHPVQAAFIAHDGFQCGFCTPGQIMSAIGLLREGQAGDDPERVREGMSGNLCRCGAYAGITEAVLDAQTKLAVAQQERST